MRLSKKVNIDRGKRESQSVAWLKELERRKRVKIEEVSVTIRLQTEINIEKGVSFKNNNKVIIFRLCSYGNVRTCVSLIVKLKKKLIMM